MIVNIQRFKKNLCSNCGDPLDDDKHWLCKKCRADIVCPIHFDEYDSKEVIAEKWKDIKQWYKDHPKADDYWEKWREDLNKFWNPDLQSKFYSQKKPANSPVKSDIFDTNGWTF